MLCIVPVRNFNYFDADLYLFCGLVQFGSNPSGATTPPERRKAILALARQYKFIILEGWYIILLGERPYPNLTVLQWHADDPYHNLYYGDAPRPPSYFALEAADGLGTGLVMRFISR